MELENRKGFVHTLEAVIAASLLITTASVVIPQIQPDTRLKDNTQENIFQGLQTLDKTGDLRNDLSTAGLEDEIKFLNPNEFNLTVLVSDTTTETIKLNVDEIPWRYDDRAEINQQKDWSGNFNQTSVDRANNSGDLGLGYRNGTSDDDLVGFWRMDKTDGNIVDYSGLGNDGTNNGAERGVQGVFSTNSFNFSGSTAELNTKGKLKDTISSAPLTISFWIKPTPDNSNWNAILRWKAENGTGSKTNIRTEMLGDENDSIYTRFVAENNECGLTTGDGGFWARNNQMGYDPGEWNLYTVTYNGDVVKEYSNGIKQAESNVGCEIADPITNISLVSLPNSEKIDELRIQNNVLSENEIKRLYFSGNSGIFEGNYSDTYDLPYEEVPEEVRVDSSNIDAGNVSWLKVDSSEGESAEFQLDSGSTDRNYSLGFSQAASEIDIEFNFSVDNSTPINSPVIDHFKIWTNDSSDGKIEFDKEGDSVKSQIFVDSSDSLNISYDEGIIAENITEERYVFQQTRNDGILKFYGDANLTVDITNKTIRGDAADEDDVKNVNYPVYQNGSKEVTVSTWN